MSNYIIYKGTADQYRYREVDENGESVKGDDGNVLPVSPLFATFDEAAEAVKTINPDATITDREAELVKANEELEAQKAAEPQESGQPAEEQPNGEVNIQ